MPTVEQYRIEMMAVARSYLGVPYIDGGASRSGVDCSGLAMVCAEAIGVQSYGYHGSALQFNGFQAERVYGPPFAGCFVFFEGGEQYGPRPGHVGLCVGTNLMIDAPYYGVDVRYDTFYPGVNYGPMAYFGAIDLARIGQGIQKPSEPMLYLKVPHFTGAAVELLQQALVAHGFGKALGPSGVDGDFGQDTKNSAENFQRSKHLVIDGVVGHMTWTALGL
jgi:peptidoglycan hydrolase-like protein with peptidoglycan-binding domain